MTMTVTMTVTVTMTGMMDTKRLAAMVIEKAADDETASGTVGDKGAHNSFSGSGMLRSVQAKSSYIILRGPIHKNNVGYLRHQYSP